MSISHLFIVFICASLGGWIYESIYCTVKTTHWQNRGFLFGPICPIYGFGFLGASFLYIKVMVENHVSLSWPVLFLICAAGSAVLEYVTSYVLEKLFHARWWDYSKVPLNINGRICLPATTGFGIAGVVFIEWVMPFLGTHMTAGGLRLTVAAEESISLILMFVFGADLALSVSAVTRLMATLERIETEFDQTMRARYEPIGKTQRAIAGKLADAKATVTDKIDLAGERAEDYREALTEYVKNLSHLQVNTLKNIKVFSSVRSSGAAARIMDMMQRGKKAAGSIAGKMNVGRTDETLNTANDKLSNPDTKRM